MKYDIAPSVNKVFGIGLSRTGTTSLAKALEILGFSCMHYPKTIGEVELCRACCDTPVALGYKFLDFVYPKSKFICTCRGCGDWLKSCEKYWKTNLKTQPEQMQKLHRALYGTVSFQPGKFAEAYLRHENDVTEYFRGREATYSDYGAGDFIWLNVSKGCGWEIICPFLGVPIPDVPFPHLNSQSYD